ncbi:MAG: class I SAM-dependent methyltransferase [Gammaproteobacteria bacterium]|nr:MAG: class I SAM-dependent methyltransferase [Gammaproteobacteria bacterium]
MAKSEAFETYALEYDAWFENHKTEYTLELKAIRELLPKTGEGVEIGAGTGRFTQPLGISLGIEPSEAMRNIATGRGVNIIEGSAESLPLDNDIYDYALLVTTVCFLDDVETAFREVYRILKANGFIIVGLIDKKSVLGKRYEEKKTESKYYRDATFHSADEIQKELINAGFNNCETVQALLPGDVDKDNSSEIKQGYGEGSFVVIRAQKYIST